MDTETLTKPIRVKGKSSEIKGSFSLLAEVSQDEKKREKGERERESLSFPLLTGKESL